MAEIPLRAYVEEINSLVDKKQVDEAIAHCKHILTYYPKHLGTYQALGKALLEKGRHADAADIFQRVLAAIPDDYVSHVGMSIVREDESNVEGALWHMERAFEVMPSNSAIQEELRRLYGRRDGVMPPRTRLTRGALARLYAKGALYAQAEAELKKALADDPDRFDLANILAQVYWQTNRRKEAALQPGSQPHVGRSLAGARPDRGVGSLSAAAGSPGPLCGLCRPRRRWAWRGRRTSRYHLDSKTSLHARYGRH